MHAHVSVIQFGFKSRNVLKISWIPGRLDLPVAETKNRSPVIDALQLTFADGRIAMDFQLVCNTVQTERLLG